MYSAYYRTPRLYLSGYNPNGQPLPPKSMMDDIVGDYKDKTVTLEDFPFFANNIKMASVHPCKHASVMKTLLDRADAALRIRREKLRAGKAVGGDQGMEGLVDELGKLDVKDAQAIADKNDEWEEVEQSEVDDQEVAIRVDQYLVVFLKVRITQVGGMAGVFANRNAVYGQCDTWHRTRFHDGSVNALWHGSGLGVCFLTACTPLRVFIIRFGHGVRLRVTAITRIPLDYKVKKTLLHCFSLESSCVHEHGQALRESRRLFGLNIVCSGGEHPAREV